MKKSRLALCGISLVVLLCCSPAFADTFSFNFSGPGYTGSGTFTATATTTAGQYLINSVTGLTNGLSITGLLAPGIYPPAGDLPNDNLLFYPLNNGGALDTNGFSYGLSSGADFNLYYYDGVYSIVTGANLTTVALNSFTLTDTTTGTPIVGGGSSGAAPEPSSLLLLATGALGVAGITRRRFAI